jgi:protein tyrosine phosphatase (PTP) superfamily phosphohydrolase (DUF442 family)
MADISFNGAEIRTHRGPQLRLGQYAAVLAALFAAVGLWLFRGPLFSGNFHTVIPNEVYRSAQLSPVALERRIKEFSLRSVINLRTGEMKASWIKAEQKVTKVHGVDLHLVRLSASMPPQATLQKLVHLFDTARRPLLLHCEKGVMRSSFASAVAVLLAGGDVEEARKQFKLTYGFVPLNSYSDLLKVLDDYRDWLTVRVWSHTPERFRRWVENDYIPYFYRARLEPLDVPTSIAKGSRTIFYFRATNTSPQLWRLSSKPDHGIHIGAKVLWFNPSGQQKIELRGGFRDFTVAPGESVVLELEIPPILESGRYQFLVDLVDEYVHWFSDMGSEPILFDLHVEDSASFSGKRAQPPFQDTHGGM